MIFLCTICSDLLNPSENLYVTKCGHLFHYDCLHTWIVKAKTCPQCRNKVSQQCMFRFYPTTTDTECSEEENAAKLQMKLDHAMLKINQQSVELKGFQEKIDTANSTLEKTQETVKSLEQKLISRTSALAAYKDKVTYLETENKKLSNLEKELELCQKKMQALQGLQVVLNGTADEVENMLEGYPDVRTIATFATALKKALYESESRKTDLRNRLQAARAELAEEKLKFDNLLVKYEQLSESFAATTKNYEGLKNKYKSNLENNLDKSVSEDPWCSMLKPKKSLSPKIIDKTNLYESNTSLNTLINRIENADSPYLNLKQSNLAWATIQNPSTSKNLSQKPLQQKPSMLTTKKPSQSRSSSDENRSIFHESKKTGFVNFFDEKDQSKSELNTSYDGLGGHAPSSEILPKPRSMFPKVTAKHRLKRPNTDSAPNLIQFLKKHRPPDSSQLKASSSGSK